MVNNKGIEKAIASLKLKPSESRRILLCGYTGCGKTVLLLHLFVHMQKKADLKTIFLIADLKMIEWKLFTDPRLLCPVITDVSGMEAPMALLLGDPSEHPTLFFWDCFDDYILSGKKELDNFCRLLKFAQEKNVSIFAATSRVDHPEEYLAYFDDILIGNWSRAGYSHMPLWFRQELAGSGVGKLKSGNFLHMRDQKLIKSDKNTL